MKKAVLFIVLALSMSSVFSQKTKPSLRLKAYQRSYISGVAPTATIEIGGKETAPTTMAQEPEYFIYLIAHKLPSLKIERIWIRQQLYLASIHKINLKPVVLQEGPQKDTLVKYTDEVVWQIRIMGKDSSGLQPKKDIANQVKKNELVVQLNDKSGNVYIRTVKEISILDALRGQ